MPAPLRSKEEVLAILVDVFRRDGYDGASLATLSAATGLGKSSLYHAFPGGKEDMMRQVLGAVADWLQREVVERLERPGTPAARLDRLFDALGTLYENGNKPCLLGRLCASVDAARFRAPLARIFETWIAAVTAVLMDAGLPRKTARQRAEDVVMRVQGALVLCQAFEDDTPFRRTIRQLRSELLADSPKRSSKNPPRRG